MLGGFNIALVDVVDSGKDDIQFGCLIKINLSWAGFAFEDEIWFIAAVVGKYRLQHVVEIGGLVWIGIGWERFSWLQQKDFVYALEVAFVVYHLFWDVVQPSFGVEEVFLGQVDVASQYLLEGDLFDQQIDQEGGLVICVNIVDAHEGVVKIVGFKDSEIVDAEIWTWKAAEESRYFFLDIIKFIFMLLEKLIGNRVEGGEGDGFRDQSEQDHEDSFELEGHGVAVDEVSDWLPVDDLDECVDEETYFLEEWVAELDCFVVELYVFAELAGQQLDEHLSFERGVPGFLHVVKPLLADSPGLEELAGCEVGEDVVGEHLCGEFADGRLGVEVEGILTFNGHYVGLAHLEFDVALDRIVLDYVCWIRYFLLRAIAVRFDMFDRP